MDNSREVKSKDVEKTVAHFLKLKNGEYLLDLSEEEAIEMGVSKYDYNKVLNKLDETNKKIQSIKSEPNSDITLFDPQDVSHEMRQQALPSGRLTSVGQEQVGTSFFAPVDTTKVRFSCRGNAALSPFFTCKTSAFGGVHQKTEIGSSLFFIDIDVPIAASNTYVSIYFKTSDSNGGICDWQLMY